MRGTSSCAIDYSVASQRPDTPGPHGRARAPVPTRAVTSPKICFLAVEGRGGVVLGYYLLGVLGQGLGLG